MKWELDWITVGLWAVAVIVVAYVSYIIYLGPALQ